MSEIPRLIRLAARRSSAADYIVMRFRALRSLADRFRRKTMEDGVSGNVVLEAMLQGYLSSHPAVLSMVDQWIRESGAEPPERHAPKLSRRDLDEIHAASSLDRFAEEERDG